MALRQLTAMFPSERHARYAIDLIASRGVPVHTTIRPILDERGEVQVVLLDIDVATGTEESVIVLLRGAHGVLMSATAVSASAIA